MRIRLVPPADAAFRAVVERACLAASIAGVGLDTPDAARIVEEELRAGGYPRAEVGLFRSVEDVRSHVSNWIVWRDGRSRRMTPDVVSSTGPEPATVATPSGPASRDAG